MARTNTITSGGSGGNGVEFNGSQTGFANGEFQYIGYNGLQAGDVNATRDNTPGGQFQTFLGSLMLASGTDDVSNLNPNAQYLADKPGMIGNSITLTFNGTTDTYDSVLSAWNIANPSNTATLVKGTGTDVPDAQTIQFAGGGETGYQSGAVSLGGSNPIEGTAIVAHDATSDAIGLIGSGNIYSLTNQSEVGTFSLAFGPAGLSAAISSGSRYNIINTDQSTYQSQVRVDDQGVSIAQNQYEMFVSQSDGIGWRDAQAGNTYVLPTATAPTVGQVLGVASVAGGTYTLDFQTAGGGGTPGGADTNIQINNSGSFYGNDHFTYNYANNDFFAGQLPAVSPNAWLSLKSSNGQFDVTTTPVSGKTGRFKIGYSPTGIDGIGMNYFENSTGKQGGIFAYQESGMANTKIFTTYAGSYFSMGISEGGVYKVAEENNGRVAFYTNFNDYGGGDYADISNHTKWYINDGNSIFGVNGDRTYSTPAVIPGIGNTGLNNFSIGGVFDGPGTFVMEVTITGKDNQLIEYSSSTGTFNVPTPVISTPNSQTGTLIYQDGIRMVVQPDPGQDFTGETSIMDTVTSFTANIDAVSLVDTFDLTKDSVLQYSNYPTISQPFAIALAGVSGSFFSQSGHDIGDTFTFTYAPGYSDMLHLDGQNHTYRLGTQFTNITVTGDPLGVSAKQVNINAQSAWTVADFVSFRNPTNSTQSYLNANWNSGNPHVDFGDIAGGNGTKFSLDDSSGVVYVATDTSFTVRNTSGNIVMYAQNDGGDHRFRAGDVSSAYNGTLFDLSDATQQFIAQFDGKFTFSKSSAQELLLIDAANNHTKMTVSDGVTQSYLDLNADNFFLYTSDIGANYEHFIVADSGSIGMTSRDNTGVASGLGLNPTSLSMDWSGSGGINHSICLLDSDGATIKTTEVLNVEDHLNNSVLRADPINKWTDQRGAVASSAMQVATSGSPTISNGKRGMYYDPASIVASATITLPASPIDGQETIISFGGTLTTGTVVTILTIAPNSGQSILGTLPTTATIDTMLEYKWRSATNQWYRID